MLGSRASAERQCQRYLAVSKNGAFLRGDSRIRQTIESHLSAFITNDMELKSETLRCRLLHEAEQFVLHIVLNNLFLDTFNCRKHTFTFITS